MGYLHKAGLIALLLTVGCSSGRKQNHQNKNDLQENQKATSQTTTDDSAYFVFPEGGEVFVRGDTYTLKWEGETDSSIALFLIDSSLESEGVSVSISDRVYHLPQTGSYDYHFPQRLNPGTYKFKVGRAESNYFQVKKHTSNP